MKMFREILSILRKGDLLKQATDEAAEMFSKAESMFIAAVDMIMECKKPDMDMYAADREINRMEWEVRRKVLEHLVIGSSKEDVPAVLILTSAVVDIERIGDYSNNILELADICAEAFVTEKDHVAFFREIEAQILEIFALTRDAHRDADAEKAKKG